MLQKVGEAEALQLEASGSLTGVKHIDDIEAQISLQPKDIHVSSMEYFQDLGVCKHW